MAAILNQNPLIIAAADVAGAALIVWPPGSAIAVPLPIHILQIEFMGYTADTDTCDILNAAGNNIWHGDGATDKQTVRSGHIGTVEGIKIAQTGITAAGTVKIYFK